MDMPLLSGTSFKNREIACLWYILQLSLEACLSRIIIDIKLGFEKQGMLETFLSL